ncbi:hypothetical protein LTR48_006218 [Friedmanniomyces endolithicus]|uniref:Uncharacterized protein n=1 Tax=Rachicladosporium monterosium TaxID=1507873 RepID=A0ABR0KZF7_9PEZI|nr:hypothetical protein LTR48_006218 [Friedmanniomyces endolithicus]KAK5141106.1 hypothetical protein LTR32_006251 [Rachicladosporium monterosium]
MCVHEVVLTGNGSPPNIVAVEYRLHERCGDCKTTSAKFDVKAVKSSRSDTDDTQPAASEGSQGKASSSGN